jgi:hypothetical protein
MKLQVLRGFSLGGGIDVFKGDTLTVPEDLDKYQAEQLERQGRIKPVMGDSLVAKAALLAAISMAPSLTELNELVCQEETDLDIIAAYQARTLELEEQSK